MQRLSGTEAAFLYLETPSTHMQVTGTLVLDPTTMEGGYSFEAVRRLLADRLHLLPPFRRRLVDVPLGLGHRADGLALRSHPRGGPRAAAGGAVGAGAGAVGGRPRRLGGGRGGAPP